MLINRWIILSVTAYITICLLLYFFATSVVISVFFKLLNFAIMAGVIAFVFYKKLYSSIKKTIHQDELKKEALAIRYDELIGEKEQLKSQMEDQDQECRYLLCKIDKWKSSFDERQRQHEVEREQAHLRAQKRAQLQSEWFGRALAYDKIIQQATDLMHSKLAEKFSSADRQKKFIGQLVAIMRKSVS